MPSASYKLPEQEFIVRNCSRLVCVIIWGALTAFGMSGTHAREDSPADALPPAVKFPVLASLTPAVDDLPDGCQIRSLPKDEPQVQGLKNREINTNPKFYLIGDERLRRLLDEKQIRANYFGMYFERRERNECGIIGWQFTDAKQAQKAAKALQASYANEPNRVRIWRHEATVIWLWRDPGVSDACFLWFEKFVGRQLK